MPQRPRTEICEKDITGLKYFQKLDKLLAELQDAGCERDRAGNRQLHMDQYCMLILLCVFNPIVSSLRALQQASELKKVQKKLGCQRASLGSLSESTRVFDAQKLKPIIEKLAGKLQPIAADSRLKNITGLTLVDGSLVKALPRIAMASVRDAQAGQRSKMKWTLHTHFEVSNHVPRRMEVTPTAGGPHDERAVMERSIESDRTYVFDRGYAKFSLFNSIVDARSSYVCRVRDNSVYEILEQRELTDADLQARVIRDEIVRMGLSSSPTDRPNHTIRLVQIEKKPHVQKTKADGSRTGPECDGVLRLATNLTDVPAEIIALLYHYRWTIEIFFRFFKHVLGCRHLLSHSQNGIEIQVYCAIIACMLISLWTGLKPTLRTHEMICWYFCGMADEDELLAHIRRLKPQT